MKWEDQFDELILDRGYDYYQGGRVREVVLDGEEVKALVRGSDMYRVSLVYEEGDPSDMSCDCPYAAKGFTCQHMAAVLFQFESDEVGDEKTTMICASQDLSPMPLDVQGIGDLVDEADEAFLREFLKKSLLEDESWLVRFWTALKPSSEALSADFYRSRIQRQIDRHERLFGWRDWWDAQELIDEVQLIFMQGMDTLRKGGLFKDLFDLSSFLLHTLADFDQSSESHGELLAYCEYAWQLIDEEGDAEDGLYLLKGLIQLTEACSFPDLTETIDEFVYSRFDREPFLPLKVDLIEERIRRLEKGEVPETSYRGWILGPLYRKRMELMEKESASWRAISDFASSHRHYAPVRLSYAEACEGRGELDRAISLLEESLKLDEEEVRSYAVESYRVLARLYRAKGKTESYLATVWRLATRIEPENAEHYRALREGYGPQAWPEHRTRLLGQLRSPHARERILAEEGLLDELLDLAVAQEGLAMVDRQREELLAFKPDRVLEKYEREILQMSEQASSRNRYRELVAVLRQMKRMPGGTPVVEKIVRGWRHDYKRRHAMQEELDKLAVARARPERESCDQVE